MQISHTLSEDVEPPSTDSLNSDPKGYHVSKSLIVHDSVHGRNSILKTHPLRKKQLKGNNSLSSFFAPFNSKAGESDGQFGDRFGSFDEDDDRPPSALSRRDLGVFDLSGSWRTADGDHRYPPFFTNNQYIVNCSGPCLWANNSPRAGRKGLLSGTAPFFTPLAGPVSYLSWFRSVPIGRLAPPGIVAWQ